MWIYTSFCTYLTTRYAYVKYIALHVPCTCGLFSKWKYVSKELARLQLRWRQTHTISSLKLERKCATKWKICGNNNFHYFRFDEVLLVNICESRAEIIYNELKSKKVSANGETYYYIHIYVIWLLLLCSLKLVLIITEQDYIIAIWNYCIMKPWRLCFHL